MKKSYILQSLAVALLITNILGLDFNNLSDYGSNKIQIISITIALFLLFFQLLEDGDKQKAEKKARQQKANKNSKAFGKRKEL